MARNDQQVTGWVGWVYFAGFVLLVSGMLQIISGLSALLNSGFYAVVDGKVFLLDIATWGWIHLILGILVVCTGTALFSGAAWARVVGVVLAVLNLVTYFAFISAYPIWSITVMVLDLVVIYALTVHGGEAAVDK